MNATVRALLQWFFGMPKKLKQVGYVYVLVVASLWAIFNLASCATPLDPNSLEGRRQIIIHDRAANCIEFYRDRYGGTVVDTGPIASACYDAARKALRWKEASAAGKD